MSVNRPLRAVLVQSFHCFGRIFHKGEIYDIAEFGTSNGRPFVSLKIGIGAMAVMPLTIQILAPDHKHKPNKKRWHKKTKNVY